MKRRYWDLRHFLWDLREWLLVREIARRMARTEELFVHPRNGGPARCVIHGLETSRDPENHDHIEGRRKQ